MPALGDRFRTARESRGLSLSDVSEQVRIRSVYLAAIEEENWKSIGAAVYVRGFLRTYARFLGLDPEAVVAEFNGQIQAETPAPEYVPLRSDRTERSSKPGSLLLWVAGAVAVLLVAFVAYNALTMRHEQAAPVAQVSASPSAGASEASEQPDITSPTPFPGASATSRPGPTVPAQAAGMQTLALVLSSPSWLRVTVDGSVSIEGTFPAGTTKTFHGKSALVRVGNAGGVEIYVDGKDVGKLGKAGDVAEHAFTL